jgi:hypothetical protein
MHRAGSRSAPIIRVWVVRLIEWQPAPPRLRRLSTGSAGLGTDRLKAILALKRAKSLWLGDRRLLSCRREQSFEILPGLPWSAREVVQSGPTGLWLSKLIIITAILRP